MRGEMRGEMDRAAVLYMFILCEHSWDVTPYQMGVKKIKTIPQELKIIFLEYSFKHFVI